MKAIDIAIQCEDAYEVDHRPMDKEIAAELRRLLEVNAEMLNALEMARQYLCKRVVNTGGEGETKVLPTINRTIAKAKDQQ